jgi:hypothetical protein
LVASRQTAFTASLTANSYRAWVMGLATQVGLALNLIVTLPQNQFRNNTSNYFNSRFFAFIRG